MSISTPQGGGDEPTEPETIRVTRPGSQGPAGGKPPSGAKPAAGAKAAAAKAPGARPAGSPARSNRPGGSGGGRRRPPVVVVKPARNWTPIWISGVVGVIVIGILVYAVLTAIEKGEGWQEKADKISGIVDYREKNPAITGTSYREHTYATVKYETTPPAYGDHNPEWQRCDGDVYDGQISNENAVHALEHGAVWITYDPSLITQDQANYLATTYVTGNNYMLMSQYPDQGAPLSLQAWGFQLKINDGDGQADVTDSRIQQFIDDLRLNTTLEPGIDCSSGEYVTALGTQPHDVEGQPNPSASATQGMPSGTPSAASPTPAP